MKVWSLGLKCLKDYYLDEQWKNKDILMGRVKNRPYIFNFIDICNKQELASGCVFGKVSGVE
jgi:hypothetical protein